MGIKIQSLEDIVHRAGFPELAGRSPERPVDRHWNSRPLARRHNSDDPSELAFEGEQHELLRQAIERYCPDTETVRRRYGIGCHAQTLASIGEEAGITRQAVAKRLQRDHERILLGIITAKGDKQTLG
jgi:hypothetical protein